MKKIQWQVVLKNDQMLTLENASGLPQDEIESHLIILGILENIKNKHLEKLNTLFEKTLRKDRDGS